MAMADLLFSVPWCCGEKDCPVQWHLAGYWIDDEAEGGYTVDNYSDGDHDMISEDELPKQDEIDKAWNEYYLDVVYMGRDPLGQFIGIKATRKVRERWQFKCGESIIGPVLLGARRRQRQYVPMDLPEHIRRYLNLDKGARKLQDFAKYEDLIAAVPAAKPHRWFTQYIDHDLPRPAARVEAELKRAARKALREQGPRG